MGQAQLQLNVTYIILWQHLHDVRTTFARHLHDLRTTSAQPSHDICTIFVRHSQFRHICDMHNDSTIQAYEYVDYVRNKHAIRTGKERMRTHFQTRVILPCTHNVYLWPTCTLSWDLVCIKTCTRAMSVSTYIYQNNTRKHANMMHTGWGSDATQISSCCNLCWESKRLICY